MAYEHPKQTQEELDTNRIKKQKLIDEANANARETIKQAAISAAARELELRGQTLHEVRLPDSIGE